MKERFPGRVAGIDRGAVLEEGVGDAGVPVLQCQIEGQPARLVHLVQDTWKLSEGRGS